MADIPLSSYRTIREMVTKMAFTRTPSTILVNQQWKLFREQHGPTHRRQSQLRQLLSLFIATPADHFPNSLLLMCPVQYHILLQKTFGDTTVFRPSHLGAEEIMTNIQENVPSWIQKQYYGDVRNLGTYKFEISSTLCKGFSRAQKLSSR